MSYSDSWAMKQICLLACLFVFVHSLGAQEALQVALVTFGSEQEVETDEITVHGEPVPTYGAARSETAMKTDTPLLDTPQTITVIPRKLIDDQADVTLSEALRNVGGVNVSGTYRDFDIYSIRGFLGPVFPPRRTRG